MKIKHLTSTGILLVLLTSLCLTTVVRADGYTPAGDSRVALWFKADAGVTVANPGSDPNVLSWANQSSTGSDFDATSGLSLGRTCEGHPGKDTTIAPNGRVMDVLRFDNDSSLVIEPADHTVLDFDELTIYAVTSTLTNLQTDTNVVYAHRRGEGDTGHFLDFGGTGVTKRWHFRPGLRNLFGKEIEPSDTLQMVVAHYSNGLAGNGNEYQVNLSVDLQQRDGTARPNGETVNYPTDSNTDTSIGGIGCSNYFEGDIAEIIVVDVHDGEVDTRIKSYLYNKYFAVDCPGVILQRALDPDINGDCEIDYQDFSQLAELFMNGCTDPTNIDCDQFYK